MVGLIPLFAVETLEEKWLEHLPEFKKRTDWFLENRPDLTDDIACMQDDGQRKSTASVNRHQRTTAKHFALYALGKRIFVRLRHSRTFAFSQSKSVYFEVDGNTARRSNTNLPNRVRECSAATRTGAVRSGFRSIIF